MLVTYWWSTAGGVVDLGGWATGLTSIGRLSGLIASILLLFQVLLMARVPVVERAYGQDRLARVHRWIGFTSFTLMLLHIVAISWGYGSGRITAAFSTLWNMTITYPGMLLAAAGSACVLLVAVSSVKAARRRLRYESWHLLHLYAYLGAGFALPHQLWTGQAFIGSPLRTAFWWTAWGLSAGAVLIWRVGGPLRVNVRHRFVVESVVPEGDDLWSVYVAGRRLEKLKVEAGQFFSWRFLNGAGWTRANPYSLSAAPDGRRLRITVQSVGEGSSSVHALKAGTRVLVEGPYGRLSSRPRTRPKLAFIGAGVGSTPLRALAEGLAYEPGEAVYVERFTESSIFAEETQRLAFERGLRVIAIGGRRRAPDSWLSNEAGDDDDPTTLRSWIPDIAERDVYICGPARWADLVSQTLRTVGVPDQRIHLETFAW